MIKINNLKIQVGSKILVDINSLPIENTTVLVGQSGSGKSLSLKAILGLLPAGLQNSLYIDAPFKLERGKSIGFVPQNPFTALSPMTKISKQFFAPKESVKEFFDMLSLDWRLFDEFPPNLSGGQLQRVILAIALINKPQLLLLDEPTTALDKDLRDEMITLLLELQKRLGFHMLFVTHEIDLAARLKGYMVVLQDGVVVEEGGSLEIMNTPKSDYTKELIEANFANREFRK